MGRGCYSITVEGWTAEGAPSLRTLMGFLVASRSSCSAKYNEFLFLPTTNSPGTPMAKQQVAKSEPQRASYVTPRILTLKVNLSFASSNTDLNGLIGLGDHPHLPAPAETETRQNKGKAAGAAQAAILQRKE